MDYLLQGMFGEKSLTKIAGVFSRQSEAEATVGRLLKLPGMQPGQIRLLGPQDAKIHNRELMGRKLEPEQHGIFQTLIRTHVVTGLAGAVIGVLLYLFLLQQGYHSITSSPELAFIAIVGFAITFGLMLGGLVALRPDHIRLIHKVRTALRHNQWAVVVHPTDTHQTALAKDLLDHSDAEVHTTL